MSINLSYIIITYNSADFIGNCLNSIARQQSNEITSEVILIDNASKDLTVEIVRKKFPQVILRENRENVGFAVAVNQAFSLSKGEHVLLLNPDTILNDNFINQLFSFVNRTPDASIIGVKIVDENNRHHPSTWKKVSFLTLLAEMLLPYSTSINLVTENPNTQAQVENVSGACMYIRRDVFEAMNGFDERFFLYYEEIDFCRRANKSGYKVYYNPYIEVVHFAAKSSSNDRESFFFNLYHNKILFIRKHYSYPFYVVVFILVLIGLLLRAAVSFIAGCLSFRKHLFSLSKSLILVLVKIIKSNYH
ncbi:MAG: glycosyltransferase family 2 protein [Bacteroidota bacterium]|nr:glycosyltransferase family 2 protein [Bacteroidota bacterium]